MHQSVEGPGKGEPSRGVARVESTVRRGARCDVSKPTSLLTKPDAGSGAGKDDRGTL